jgi:site-specific recombinase XerD
MGQERLDFQRLECLYVDVRNAMIYNNLNLSKGENAMSETLHDAAQAYLEHLRGQGKKERTLYTYGKDFEQIEAFFGAERRLASILAPHVGKFFKSDALLKLPSGKKRAKPTVDKTMRVFRMFLIWAKETGSIKKLPLPKDTPMGRSQKENEDDE